MSSSRGSAVVTGASSGIGRAVAVELARAGFRVVASARRVGALEALVAEDVGDGQIVGHSADLTEPGQVAGLFASAEAVAGNVDVVVHSVGHDHGVAPLWEESPEAVSAAVAALVTSPALVLREALATMQTHGGKVLLVSSGAASGVTPGRALYSAAKLAVNRLVESVAIEVDAADGPPIAVAAILPGRVDTPMQRRLVEAARAAPAAYRLSRFTSMSGVFEPEDVGRAVRDLLHRPVHELNGRILRHTSGGWVAAQ
jgi:NAD(P)-dependent dehydrogenase (short-subunit alcohol dehydrogenase family)